MVEGIIGANADQLVIPVLVDACVRGDLFVCRYILGLDYFFKDPQAACAKGIGNGCHAMFQKTKSSAYARRGCELGVLDDCFLTKDPTLRARSITLATRGCEVGWWDDCISLAHLTGPNEGSRRRGHELAEQACLRGMWSACNLVEDTSSNALAIHVAACEFAGPSCAELIDKMFEHKIPYDQAALDRALERGCSADGLDDSRLKICRMAETAPEPLRSRMRNEACKLGDSSFCKPTQPKEPAVDSASP